MLRLTSPAIAAVATLSFAPMPGWADSTASASLGPISIQLVDLDPTDGVDPSLHFADFGLRVSAIVQNPAAGEYADESLDSFAWAPIAASSALTTAAAGQAVLSGPATANGSMLSVNGKARTGHEFQASIQTVSSSADTSGFMLSANTMVVFAAEAFGAVEVDDYPHGDFASAYNSLKLSGIGATGTGYQTSYDFMSIAVGSGSFDGYSKSESRLFTTSFVNATDGELLGNLELNVEAYGYSRLIPEPQTYALMAAGLAIVGVARRLNG